MNKHYYLTVDIETANFVDDALAYDIGLAIIDRKGNVYETHSFLCSEIFNNKELMSSAYYAEKIPSYLADLKEGKRKLVPLYEVRKAVFDLYSKWNYKAVLAYNAYFDNSGLNRTQRYITKSKYRWFFPYGVPVHCIWHMACQVICSQKKYYNYCVANGFVTSKGHISTSAETVYSFLVDNTDFKEEHKGLEDVLIEAEIFARCISKKKKLNRKINRACWRLAQRKPRP